MNIMVIDDSLAMRLLVIKTLREAGFDGHEIIQAEDGAKALDMIRSDTPDLVLCDWNMPNMTGPELLQAMNDDGINPAFGFVTTEATPEMKNKASDMGAKFLIAKPFTPDAFKDTLGQYIN